MIGLTATILSSNKLWNSHVFFYFLAPGLSFNFCVSEGYQRTCTVLLFFFFLVSNYSFMIWFGIHSPWNDLDPRIKSRFLILLCILWNKF